MGESALSIRSCWEKSAANDETVSGETLYTYVNNNPVNANDPSGLKYVGIDANISVITGVHVGVHYDTETGNMYFNGGGDLGGGIGLGFSVKENPPPTGITFNTSVAGCVLVACLNPLSVTADPIEGTSKFNITDSYFDYSTVLDSAVSGGNFEMRAKLSGDVNFDANGVAFNVYDVWNGISSTASSAYNSVANLLGTGGSTRTPAAGGFVLYPNKPNTNAMQSVYAK